MEKYRADCSSVVPAGLRAHLTPPQSRDLMASWDCSVWLAIYFAMKFSRALCGLGKLNHGWSQLQPNPEPSCPLFTRTMVQACPGREHPGSSSCRTLRGRALRVLSQFPRLYEIQSSGPVSHIPWALPGQEQPRTWRDTGKAVL